ncbi:MAG: twin-arginine translocase subunit TatC [Planctomycetota bacterium]
MDRVARPKDDLFDDSVMTFGEHLEELRTALVRAIYWLVGGLLIGLLFANSLILFIQRPLAGAIKDYQAKRSVMNMGFDPDDETTEPLQTFLRARSLQAELVYTIPDSDAALMPLVQSAKTGAAETGPAETGPASSVADLLQKMPNVSSLKPTLQFRQNQIGLNSLKLEEPFMIWFKAGLILGAVIGSPGIFYHLWSFVAAGLHMHERRYVYVYLPISVLLFVSGVVLAFFLVLQYVLTFLLGFNSSMDIAVEPRLTYYVNFVLLLPLGFGVAFQLPIVMLFLQRIGLFETRQYIESWKVAILCIFIISMIVTPAEVTSMFALAIPLVFLYVIGILMCHFLPRGRGLGSQAYDPV